MVSPEKSGRQIPLETAAWQQLSKHPVTYRENAAEWRRMKMAILQRNMLRPVESQNINNAGQSRFPAMPQAVPAGVFHLYSWIRLEKEPDVGGNACEAEQYAAMHQAFTGGA